MSGVRLAIIGGGVIGRRHARAIDAVPEVELVAVADPAPSGRDLAAELGVAHHTDTISLFAAEKVAGVIVSTPTAWHFEPTMAALAAGCHVLVEKPIMATLDEAEAVVARAAETGLHVLVGHQRRYYGLVDKAREIIGAEDFGRLVAVNGQWTVRKDDAYYDPDWRKQRAAGPVLTNLIHEMDLLRYICGEVKSINAEVSNDIRGWDKEDTAAIVIRFANGALGTFLLSDQAASPWSFEGATGESVLFPRVGQNTMRFIGTRSALEFPLLTRWHYDGGTPDWNHVIGAEDAAVEVEDAYARQIAHFAQVIAGRAEPVIDAADGAATLRATLAVFEAAERGCRVTL